MGEHNTRTKYRLLSMIVIYSFSFVVLIRQPCFNVSRAFSRQTKNDSKAVAVNLILDVALKRKSKAFLSLSLHFAHAHNVSRSKDHRGPPIAVVTLQKPTRWSPPDVHTCTQSLSVFLYTFICAYTYTCVCVYTFFLYIVSVIFCRRSPIKYYWGRQHMISINTKSTKTYNRRQSFI